MRTRRSNTSIRLRPLRIALVGLLGLIAVGTASGCDGCSDESSDPSPDVRPDTATAERDTSSADEERSAFGMPFPPKLRDVRELESGVEVVTPMKLDALEEFYKNRLVDYETLRPSSTKIRVIGLREFMPAIRGHRYGPLTTLYYSPSRDKPEVDTGVASEEDAGIERPSVGEAPDDSVREQPKRGTPVRLETDDGEPLAPGARWGEPYTPPEGTPLDKPRYRENFGKPFGEWQLP